MIDVQRIVGFSFCAFTDASLWDIKVAVTDAIRDLGPDDLFLIGDVCCKGADEACGYVLNSPLCRKLPDLVQQAKMTFNAVGATDIDCPKQVFIISEMHNDSLLSAIQKWSEVSKKRNYECSILPMMLNCKDERCISFTKENLKEKIQNAISN